jgi:hypothetical protein
MKTSLAAAIAAIAILAVVLVANRGDETPSTIREGGAAKSRQLPASSVLRINPGTTPSPPVESRPAPANVPPEVVQLRARTGWAPLRERLATASASPAALYAQAEIYNRCAKRAVTRPGAITPQNRAQARERFIAAMDGQPDLAQRLAAWDKGNVDLCEGIPAEDFSEEKLAALITAAAQAGDARAQAWEVARAVDAAFQAQKPGDRPRGNVITDEQVETIRRTLASRDPGVVREYQGLLASTVDDGTWRLPGIEGRVDERALYGALTLLACDLGDNCGPDSRQLLSSCAQNGYCAATNLYDHQYFYESSPNSAQLMERYRQALLQAITSGDLSGLRISRETTNNNRQYMFRGGWRGP